MLVLFHHNLCSKFRTSFNKTYLGDLRNIPNFTDLEFETVLFSYNDSPKQSDAVVSGEVVSHA